MIVAYNMLGGPISQEHGGPVRLYVAPMYGYKSIKWLSRVECRGSSRARLLGDGRPNYSDPEAVGRTKQWPQRPGDLTAAGVPRPDSGGAGFLLRFDPLERLVHWVTAVLFGTLILTGAALIT